MGSPQSKPEDRLRYISKEVSSLRSSLRQSRQNLSRSKKEAIVESLANQSGEVSAMHGKVKQKKIDETLKNISATMEEILQIDLDMAAVESDSFIHVPGNQRPASSVGSLTSQKINKRSEQRVGNRSNLPTIREIEAKVEELRSHISTAIDNRDSKQLRVHKTTIELIAKDLEMITVDVDTPLEKRKQSITKRLSQLYHKINTVLKDLKREDNIQFLSNQSQKEKAIKELADIELHLAENESLLDKLTKEKDMSNMASIRNNIMQINQRLAKINLVDNEVKGKVIGLSQKCNEIIKNLDRTLSRKEFDSKLAQLLETYERVIKNFDGATNVDSTKNTLENLRDSVENLKEVSDSTKNRKRNLLSKINKHLELFDDELRRESDRKVIQEIVEDNVILRKKVKSSDKEHTVIDQFINYWNNVKSNFDVNSYSNLSLLRIDSILEEMQQSINDIRVGIANKCDTNPPTSLTKKQSHSTPRLNTKKDYGSNQSLNHLENKLIKAKAKMYNISTPELLNVQDESYVNSRFSKIEEIKTQVHYIKEKMDKSQNKSHLREKLENNLQVLANYYKDSNKTVSNNAIIVSNEITELLHVLVMSEFKEQGDALIEKARNFSGTRFDEEFDDIKDKLIKLQVSVEHFNIPDLYESLQREKDHLLDEIFYNIETLQEKSSFYRKHEDESVKKIKAKLQTLSDKVKKFSGTYKGVPYNQIERDLNKLLLQIGEQVEDKISNDEMTREAEKLLKILEQRASLAQSFRTGSKSELSKKDNQARMTKIKTDLYNIKNEMDRTPDDNVDAFIGLQSRLDLVNLELGQISARSNENLEKEKEIFSNEAQTLRNVVDAKVALGQQPLVQWPEREIQQDLKSYPKNDVNKEMEKLESKFQKIKEEISAPGAEEDIHKYYKLAQEIRKLAEKLEQYKFIKNTDLFVRKTNLSNEMQYYIEGLEKDAKDAKYVISIEENLNRLENILDSNQHSDLKTMAKELKAIQAKLENHKVSSANETLRERKSSVQQKTDGLALKLKQMADSEKQIKETQLKEDNKKISEIESKVKALRPEIDNFVGIQSDRKFYELDETTMRLILILDKFDTANPELQKRKIKIIRELHQFGQILDEKAQQTEQILDLEHDLENIASHINAFSGREEDYLQIKYELEEVAKKAQNLRTSKVLIPRRNVCMEKLSVLFNKLMSLSVSTTSPEVKDDQKYQSSDQINTVQSSGYSSTSSSRINIVEHSTSDYSSTVSNFNNSKDTKSTTTPGADQLIQIEKSLKKLELFLARSMDENELQRIDDAFTHYTLELGSLHYPKDSPEDKKRGELYGIIENLTENINEKIDYIEDVSRIEQEVDKIGDELNSPMTQEQINQLDERLRQLQVSLGKMNNMALKTRIDACMKKVTLYAKSISDYNQSTIEDIARIEQEVDKIGNKLNSPITEEQINQLDERLRQLQIGLAKINNMALKAHIDACMMKVILYAKIISDYKQSTQTTSV